MIKTTSCKETQQIEPVFKIIYLGRPVPYNHQNSHKGTQAVHADVPLSSCRAAGLCKSHTAAKLLKKTCVRHQFVSMNKSGFFRNHHSLLLEHSFMLNTKCCSRCFEKPPRRVDHGKCHICTISRSSSLSNNTGRLFYLETGCNNGASGGHRGEVKSSQQQQQQHKEIRTEDGNKRTACVEICGKALRSFHRGGNRRNGGSLRQ